MIQALNNKQVQILLSEQEFLAEIYRKDDFISVQADWLKTVLQTKNSQANDIKANKTIIESLKNKLYSLEAQFAKLEDTVINARSIPKFILDERV